MAVERAGEANAGAAMASVHVKLPPYWASDLQVWFAQVEAQFATRRITSQKTRYDHVVASLAPKIATEVRDLILTPPDENPYDTLKGQLIGRTAASEQKRLQLLLNAEELGDRKPTQLLRRMQQLMGDKRIDDSLVRELFLQCLPTNVRMVLASTGATVSLSDLAQLADKIMEVAAPSISAVAATPSVTEIDLLRAEITSLKALVKSLASSTARSHRSSRHGSPSPARASSPADTCWYHSRFRDQAQKCRPPCARAENDQASR